MKTVYLDYAAATPMAAEVIAAMEPYFSTQFYNPSATYLAAKAAHQAIESSRACVAHWLGARLNEVIFTAGGTEANNLAIHGVMQAWPGSNVVVSTIEHESVLAPAAEYDIRTAPVQSDGRIDLRALEKLIDEHTVLVSIMYANNEIGTIEPIKEISQIIAKKRSQRASQRLPLYIHTDACQAVNYLDLHAARLGVDLMTINAGKIYGPKQCGALYVKSGTELRAQILGGGQELGRRSGTENVANIVGFATALDQVQAKRQAESQRLQQLGEEFITQLTERIPGLQVNGSLKHRLPNNVHITIPGADNERLLMELDERGIMCAAGSACSASSEQSSHVLKAIGCSDAEAYASLRFTLGQGNSQAEIYRVVTTLAGLI